MNETTVLPTAPGQEPEKDSGKPPRRRRRRRTNGEQKKAAQAEKAAPAPQQGKTTRRAKKRSRPNQDINAADPTAAIKARIFEVDPAAEAKEDLPPILPLLPEWEGSVPLRSEKPRSPRREAAPAAENAAAASSEKPSEKQAEKTAERPVRHAAAPVDPDMQQRILDTLRALGSPQPAEDLLDAMAVPALPFYHALDALETEGRLFTTRKQKVALPEQLGYVTGRLQITSRGYGFVIPGEEQEDVFVAQSALGGALNGDTVTVRPVQSQSRGASSEGEVIAIVEHANTQIVGTFHKEGTTCTLVPDNKKLGPSFPAVNARRGAAKDGQKVVCRMDYAAGKQPVARVHEVLGWPEEAGTDVLSIIRAHDLPEAFPKVVLNAARAIAQEVPQDDILRREDLRGMTIVTIDGRDSKDFDDAVSLEKLSDGNYLLGVHIADVSHYIREGSALDKEALRRGTSVYFVDRVIPMLPEELSNGICSLNPGVDRLTLSCFMEIDPSGTVVSHRIAETVIRSSERLVYEDVTALLSGNAAMRRRYKRLIPMLTDMQELWGILNNRRMQRGSLEFELPECKVILDEQGHTEDVVLCERGIANRIIEEFMLVCNETVAEHMAHLGKPMIYRVHEVPDEEKITELAAFLGGFGLTLRRSNGPLKPKALQTVLLKAVGRPEENIVSRVSLRSLKKARYCEENLGHFGLAAEYYCHFTSPIRRYPDLLAHRVIKETLRGKLSARRTAALAAKIPEAAQHCSERERAAMETEREVDDLKKCEYLAKHVGEEFTGVISGVTSFGIFVELPNTCEGLIRVSDLPDDYYVFDEKNYRYVGRHRGAIYRLGDSVTITVAAVDAEAHRADFSLVTDWSKNRDGSKSRPASRAKAQKGGAPRSGKTQKAGVSAPQGKSAPSRSGKPGRGQGQGQGQRSGAKSASHRKDK